MAAVRLSFVWLGVRKTLTQEQKSQAADTFGAEGNYLSAAKKLLDTSHPAFKAVTSVRSRTISFWKGISLPYPEPGVRLIRQDDISAFSVQLTTLQAELTEAVAALSDRYLELKSAARQRLGRLVSASEITRPIANRSPLSFRACSRCSMACSSIGRGATSFAGRGPEPCSLSLRPAARFAAFMAKRLTWRSWARSLFAAAPMSSRTR